MSPTNDWKQPRMERLKERLTDAEAEADRARYETDQRTVETMRTENVILSVQAALADSPFAGHDFENDAAHVSALIQSWREHDSRDGDLEDVEAVLEGRHATLESDAAQRVHAIIKAREADRAEVEHLLGLARTYLTAAASDPCVPSLHQGARNAIARHDALLERWAEDRHALQAAAAQRADVDDDAREVLAMPRQALHQELRAAGLDPERMGRRMRERLEAAAAWKHVAPVLPPGAGFCPEHGVVTLDGLKCDRCGATASGSAVDEMRQRIAAAEQAEQGDPS